MRSLRRGAVFLEPGGGRERRKAMATLYLTEQGSSLSKIDERLVVSRGDKTLEEIARIPDLITPTGKFNVYNTANDVY